MTDGPDEVTIARLGAQGDGIADTPQGPQYVPLALPGERWRRTGTGWQRLSAAPARVAPPCRHYGACGGCTAQHMDPPAYAAWKRAIVVEAFRHRGLVPEIAELVTLAPGTRRRATLTAVRRAGEIALGYHGARSGEVVAIEACPVLVPAIVAALPALAEIAGLVAAVAPRRRDGAGEIRLAVLDAAGGLDLAIGTDGRRVDAGGLARIAEIAARAAIARITIDGEPAIARARPRIEFDRIAVAPPPGAFAQATGDAEAAMIARVVAAVGRAKRVADLFCGLGTFALPLARKARVLAVDGDRPAIEALAAAARSAPGLKPVETRVRDLFRLPLSRKELEGFDAVVLDPPRAGAAEQCAALARSGVPAVVMVSCNPATLARDARTLVDGGYGVEAVTPIDQFLWSTHVEAVAVLRR